MYWLQEQFKQARCELAQLLTSIRAQQRHAFLDKAVQTIEAHQRWAERNFKVLPICSMLCAAAAWHHQRPASAT